MIIDHLLEIGADLFHPQEPMELETEKFFAIQRSPLMAIRKKPAISSILQVKKLFSITRFKISRSN